MPRLPQPVRVTIIFSLRTARRWHVPMCCHLVMVHRFMAFSVSLYRTRPLGSLSCRLCNQGLVLTHHPTESRCANIMSISYSIWENSPLLLPWLPEPMNELPVEVVESIRKETHFSWCFPLSGTPRQAPPPKNLPFMLGARMMV